MPDSASTTTPLVSVVMIFYNSAPFLDEAITSVRAQTYPAWELLLVDGSTDASAVIAASHAAADPARIRLLNHPGRANRGMSASSKVAEELRQLEYSQRLARGERNVVTHGEATGQALYAAAYRVGQRPTALRPARRRICRHASRRARRQRGQPPVLHLAPRALGLRRPSLGSVAGVSFAMDATRRGTRQRAFGVMMRSLQDTMQHT